MLLDISYTDTVYSGETIYELLTEDIELRLAYETAFSESFTKDNCDRREQMTVDSKEIIKEVLKNTEGIWTVEETWLPDAAFISRFTVRKIDNFTVCKGKSTEI